MERKIGEMKVILYLICETYRPDFAAWNSQTNGQHAGSSGLEDQFNGPQRESAPGQWRWEPGVHGVEYGEHGAGSRAGFVIANSLDHCELFQCSVSSPLSTMESLGLCFAPQACLLCDGLADG